MFTKTVLLFTLFHLHILSAPHAPRAFPPPFPPIQYIYHTVYPSDLTILNSLYAPSTTNTTSTSSSTTPSRLHASKSLFMLRRQLHSTFEIATRVQFTNLPLILSNYTCRLEFVLPREDLQRISGGNPSFHVYQVERAAGAEASWDTYEGNKEGVTLFGTVNGEEEALRRTRLAAGVAAVNETLCNETLTFQMGLMYEGVERPNYWQFMNVAPPGYPVQGFRMVYGC